MEENLASAETTFRELGYPYWATRAQLDGAEGLARQGNHDESARLAGEAATTFGKLGAAPMLVRARVLLEPQMTQSTRETELQT